MAQFVYRANLASAHYPFLTKDEGRTVIVGKQDQAFSNAVVVNSIDEDKDKGIPQLYYCHNVVPANEGVQSVGFNLALAGLTGATKFNDIFTLVDAAENKFLYSPALGSNYVYNGNDGTWAISSPVLIPENALVTVAYVNGETYIFFQRVGLYKYNITTKVLDPVVMIGITATLLDGIVGANGFLMAWDHFTVYRSKILNILDFTPDPTQGSGSSIPDDIKGNIVVCLPIQNGFIIYTTKNAVGAGFTQNILYPFTYKEVKGSAGILQPTHVTWQNNVGTHYAWTQAGMQLVDKSAATLVFPGLTDFLTSKVFEDFDDDQNVLTRTNMSSKMLIKLAMIGKRFFVVSYGITSLTHALVYDLAYKRWGKLKFAHVAAFEFSLPNRYGDVTWLGLGTLTWAGLGLTTWADLHTGIDTTEYAKEMLALLQSDGTVYLVNFDQIQSTDEGVAIFGKYQFVRERLLTMDTIEVENSNVVTYADATWLELGASTWNQLGSTTWADLTTLQDDNFEVLIFPSIDGKNFLEPITPYEDLVAGDFRRFRSSCQGKNHSIGFKGSFNLASLVLTVIIEGKM